MNMERCGSILVKKRLNDLLKTLSIESDDDQIITLITSNSKETRKGSIFVSITDEYIEEALNNQAIVLTELDHPWCIQIKDAKEALGILLHTFYNEPSTQLFTIAITGTNGKSSVASLTKAMLRYFDVPSVVIGTSGIEVDQDIIETINTTPKNEIVVKTMNQCIKKKIKILIMEVSSTALSQKRIYGIKFDVLIYTNISQDHLDQHGTLENYIESKKMAMCYVKENGTVIFNEDDPQLLRFKKICKSNTIGIGTNSKDFKIDNIECTKEMTTFTLNDQFITTPLLSRVNVYNLCSSIAIAKILDLNYEMCLEWIAQVKPVIGRFEKILDEPLVYVDYAHTAKAFEETLKFFSSVKVNRLIVIFGCGGQREKQKRPLMGKIACEYADQVILCDDNPRNEDPDQIIEDICKGCNGLQYIIRKRELAIKNTLSSAEKSDIIIVVGRGNENYQTFSNKKIQFNDRKVIESFGQRGK